MGPTSTPQSLFVVQAMFIRQLLFLGFYRPNAYVSCVLVAVDFCAKMAAGHAQKGAKTKTSNGHIC
jgi:hypothetical protein